MLLSGLTVSDAVRRSEESTDPRSVAICVASDEDSGPSDNQPGLLQESAIGLPGSVGRESGKGLPDRHILSR